MQDVSLPLAEISLLASQLRCVRQLSRLLEISVCLQRVYGFGGAMVLTIIFFSLVSMQLCLCEQMSDSKGG